MNVLQKLITKITHKHDYKKIGFRETEDRFERYSVRNYECQSCGKNIWEDGRYDPYE